MCRPRLSALTVGMSARKKRYQRNNITRAATTSFSLLFLAMLISAEAVSQTTDLSGEWRDLPHEDQDKRRAGPLLGNYLGIPLNEAGRRRADSHDAADWGLPEFQCRPHPAPYQWRAAGGLRFLKEVDPVSRALVAYHVEWVRSMDRPIYMDGRPHPPDYAPHSWKGFSTGRWEGNTLVVTTTHLKESYLRRNGVMFSDWTTTTEYIIRHEDYLTIVVIIDDPIYLEEPYIHSVSYELNVHSQLPYYPCSVIQENISTAVPHFLPGENPYLTEWQAEAGIPVEATRGGAETIYPEYRSKLEGDD